MQIECSVGLVEMGVFDESVVGEKEQEGLCENNEKQGDVAYFLNI
jgi:hypothetical protein